MEKIVGIPDNVDVKIDNLKVSIKGEKGELERDFFSPLFKSIKIEKKDNKIIISGIEERKTKAMVGTIESHIKNMIIGVTKGYVSKLKIVYMHFPMTVKVSDKEILIQNFLGEKTARKTKIYGNVKVEVKGDEIIVSGTDKEEVGQTAARIEQATRIRAKDRRIYQDGVFTTAKPE